MLPVAECCVCRQPAGPHNYYGARVSCLQFENKKINVLCPSPASPAEHSSEGPWRRILKPVISATKQKYVGKSDHFITFFEIV